MKLFAPAKINLCLDILKKSPSGWHEVKTVFQEIPSLADEIEITESQEDVVTMEQSGQAIKMGDNIVQKAVLLLKENFQIKKFTKIAIRKRIPIASGLGGASSDAAAVLKSLNKQWDLDLSQNELLKFAAELGCDVPFFIVGGTALGTHFGEKITPLKPIKGITFKISSPPQWPDLHESKTEGMYNSIALSECGKNKEKTNLLLDGIEKEDKNLIIQNLHNDFETVMPVKKGEHLSGSGPVTFTATHS